jgi:hypothetical protein
MPKLIDLTKLETGYIPEPKKAGRPKRIKMPPLPLEVWEAMSQLEQEWFEFFVDAYRQDYPGMSPTDEMCLVQAALENVHLLRKHATMFSEGKLLTQGRQDPSQTLLRWLDMMDCTRKARMKNQPKTDDDKQQMADLLKRLSS